MQFVITAHDYTDAQALQRRMDAREAHLALLGQMIKSRNIHFAVALLDENERMVGSVIVCEFPSRTDIDAWFQKEPYLTGRVWEKVDVRPCKVGPAFMSQQ